LLVKFTQLDRFSCSWSQSTYSFAKHPMMFVSSIELFGIQALIRYIEWRRMRFANRYLVDWQFPWDVVLAQPHKSSIRGDSAAAAT
jgi:hypothetical protein